MALEFGPEVLKQEVFQQTEAFLGGMALHIASVDSKRPWGGFFVIDDVDTDHFIETFYPGYDVDKIKQFGDKLSLKILAVAPHQLLSWQFHHRRAELWRGIAGPAGYIRSHDDNQGEVQTLSNGDVVQFDPEERHRLVGLDNWGLVAEFWQHTDLQNPSNEDDIIRLADEYGR